MVVRSTAAAGAGIERTSKRAKTAARRRRRLTAGTTTRVRIACRSTVEEQ